MFSRWKLSVQPVEVQVRWIERADIVDGREQMGSECQTGSDEVDGKQQTNRYVV